MLCSVLSASWEIFNFFFAVPSGQDKGKNLSHPGLELEGTLSLTSRLLSPTARVLVIMHC